MEFENLEAVLGRFPTITVDMDTQLNLGSKVTIEVSASVKEIRHEQGPSGVRRVHIFDIDAMRLAPPSPDVDDHNELCCSCEQPGHESDGRWVGNQWVCRACIREATPWVDSNEGVVLPIPHGELDEE